MKMGDNKGPQGAGDEIRLLVERIQRLNSEIKELKLDVKDVYLEVKSRGFDAKTMKKLVAWLDKDPNDRREEDAILELYKAAMGVGDGSLSDAARDYVEERRGGKKPDDDGQLDAFNTPRESGKGPISEDFGDDLSDKPITEEDARRLGQEAQLAGKPVTANPFKAGDDRRLAWDEAWCGSAGSDGMDIPPELRPKDKPKKGDDKTDNPDDKKGK